MRNVITIIHTGALKITVHCYLSCIGATGTRIIPWLYSRIQILIYSRHINKPLRVSKLAQIFTQFYRTGSYTKIFTLRFKNRIKIRNLKAWHKNKTRANLIRNIGALSDRYQTNNCRMCSNILTKLWICCNFIELRHKYSD